MKQVKLALIIAISNLLLSAYYLFVGFRLSALFSEFNAETPNPIFNIYFLGFLLLTSLSFIYWHYLRRSVKRGLFENKKTYYLIPLLLSGPIIYLAIMQIYSLMVIYMIVPIIM